MVKYIYLGMMKMENKKSNLIALLPIGVFLVLYLGLGILFEYILKIPMGFYNIPIVLCPHLIVHLYLIVCLYLILCFLAYHSILSRNSCGKDSLYMAGIVGFSFLSSLPAS